MTDFSRQDYVECMDAMFEQSKTLQALVNPLYKQFGITGCGYIHLYRNGETLYYSSVAEFQQGLVNHYLENNKRFSTIDSIRAFDNEGMFLLDAEPEILAKMGDVKQELFVENDIHHQIASVDRIPTVHGEAIRLVLFSAPQAQTDINRFYLNNTELMRRIINLFTQELAESIERTPLIKPTRRELIVAQECFQQQKNSDTQKIRSYAQETNLHYPQYNEVSEIKLSRREKEVVKWFIQGKSTPEIAALLNLSEHTVRTYFDRLKKKFGSYYKPQLMLKLIDAGLIKPDDWKDIY